MYRRWLSHVGLDLSRSVPLVVKWPKRNDRNGQFSFVALRDIESCGNVASEYSQPFISKMEVFVSPHNTDVKHIS